MAKVTTFPLMVPFPEAAWREHIVPEEWEACLDAWLALAGAHLSLSNADFVRVSAKDESLPAFLTSYAEQTALSHDNYPLGNIHRQGNFESNAFCCLIDFWISIIHPNRCFIGNFWQT
jgi:activating signal cointegrator complex subunit 2